MIGWDRTRHGGDTMARKYASLRAEKVTWLRAHLDLVTEASGYGAHGTTPQKRALFAAMQAAGLYARTTPCMAADLTPLIREARG